MTHALNTWPGDEDDGWMGEEKRVKGREGRGPTATSAINFYE